MMKKWVFTAAALMFIVVVANAATFIYRYEFRDWAIQFETDKANMQRHETTINGQKVVYLATPIDASKPSLVLLHGFSASKENWLRYAANLKDDFNLIAPDLLGHGETAYNAQTDYRTHTQVSFLEAFRQSLSLPAWHLVGNSMGGAIAMHYSMTHPDHSLSATMISPAGIHTERAEMDELLEKESLNPLVAREPGDLQSVIDFVMSRPPFIPGAILAVEEERALERVAKNDKIFEDLRAQMFEGMESEIATIKTPTLFIWGEEDRVINANNLTHYEALLPNAQIHRFEDIGHLAMMELPGRTADITRDFVKALSP